MYRLSVSALATLVLVAGCAGRPPAPVAVAVAPPPAPVGPALPRGAYPGMPVPARLADGRYATPNRDLSPAATIWHLRAALNVAALACRGPDEATIVAGYNALLSREKSALATARTSYAAEYRAGGGDWQDRYDDQMTRLYNFFSGSPARDAFCNAAAATLADAATVAPADLPAFAVGHLAVLERPFTDFFAAYDAWRIDRATASRIAQNPASTPARPMMAPMMALSGTTPVTAGPPRLDLDPAVLRDTAVAGG